MQTAYEMSTLGVIPTPNRTRFNCCGGLQRFTRLIACDRHEQCTTLSFKIYAVCTRATRVGIQEINDSCIIQLSQQVESWNGMRRHCFLMVTVALSLLLALISIASGYDTDSIGKRQTTFRHCESNIIRKPIKFVPWNRLIYYALNCVCHKLAFDIELQVFNICRMDMYSLLLLSSTQSL